MVILVAIAYNEARGVTEWLAHYLALGFDRIVVYDNESDDDTARILDGAATGGYPIQRIPWPSNTADSPQMTAYADALTRFADATWIAFFDLDELLVLHAVDLQEWLAAYPEDVSAVGINWLTFASGGQITADYALVRDTFRTGPSRTMGNNKHIKSIVRPARVERMGNPHAARLLSGSYARADGSPLVMGETLGIATDVSHDVAQLHHYQLKSKQEFDEKISKGRAGKRMDDPTRIRENPETLWKKLDRADSEYSDVDVHRAAFDAAYARLRKVVVAPAKAP